MTCLLLLTLLLISAGCKSTPAQPQVPAAPNRPSSALIAEPSPTPSPPPTATAMPTNTPLPAYRIDFEPAGCREPLDDYTHVTVNGHLLSRRTQQMLVYASQLYGGSVDIANTAVTQGSYTPGLTASFGTHDAGGAVDLSVFYPGTYQPAYPDIGQLLRALRTAGFAAWLRDLDELGPNSPIHIHAIAIGDAELSPAALDQLMSAEYGYFVGGNALPAKPSEDRFGGPVICDWMAKSRPAPDESGLANHGTTTVEQVAESLLTSNPAETDRLQYQLPVPTWGADLANMNGPLAAALLQRAGLVPAHVPLHYAYSRFWFGDPTSGEKFWQLLGHAGYVNEHLVLQPVNGKIGLPELKPGDVLYVYRGVALRDDIWAVSSLNATGDAMVLMAVPGDVGYRVQQVALSANGEALPTLWAAYLQPDGSIIIEHVYRPDIGQRRNNSFEITVMPGDTLVTLARQYGLTVQDIAAANQATLADGLQAGESLTIP